MAFYLEDINKIVAHNAEVMGGGDSMVVLAGVTIGSSTDWDGVSGISGCSFQIAGTIMSVGGNAVTTTGGGNHMNITSTGALLGNLGAGAALNALAGSITLTNAGQISGYYGVNCGSSDDIIHNSGHISGTNSAIHIAWAVDNYIYNSGFVESTEGDAISIDTNGDGFMEIDNDGTIAATKGHYAIYFGAGWGDITNTGRIIGDIHLGDTNSAYRGEAGTIQGIVYGGPGDDTIITGVGRDFLIGGAGADHLEGGPGRDTFYVALVSDSTGAAHDTIDSFDFGRDILEPSANLTGIDTTITSGRLRDDRFDGDLRHAVDAAHLAAGHAVLFTPSAGNQSGGVFLIVDANGVAGYQAQADFVIELHNPENIDLFSMATFGF